MPVFVVHKPLGLTSHDVVARARRLRKTKRVGHTGTLDPLATGVLILCVEESTKLVQFMTADSKEYLAWISLGASTPTLDAEGPIESVQTAEFPDFASSGHTTTEHIERIEKVLQGFIGPQKQIPPQYSAIQLGGQRAYAVARAGGHLELPARDIVIHELTLLGAFGCLADAPSHGAELPPALGTFPTLLVRAKVGSGTYLRSLARDIGAALGVPAHLAGLLRTRVGRYDLASALTLDELADAKGYSDLSALDLPQLAVDAQAAKALQQGKRPACQVHGRHALIHEGELIAVADGDGERWRVVRAWVRS